MKIAVTGYGGRLGKYMLKYDNVVPLACDVTNPIEIEKSMKYIKPDVVLHLAAKSNPDFCEKPENQKIVIDVNVHGTHKVAEACEQYGCQMVLLSSDHVFDGKKWFGKYNEQSKASPVNYYGLTKYAAEGWANLYDNVKIVRTSYLFDKERLQDKGWGEYPTFIKRNFIHYEHFANRLVLYLQNIKDMPKVLHLAGSVNLSWYEFMRKLAIYNYDGSRFLTSPRHWEIKGDCAKRPYNLNLDVSLSKKLGFDSVSFLDGFELLTLEFLT